MSWSDGLRDAQREAASVPLGDAVLLAGPGTGKTHVLTRRIQYLVQELNLSPSKILSVTFTRAAAASMRERLLAQEEAFARRIRVSTLHSYALREILREGAQDLPTPVRVVDDWEERWVVVDELARFLGRTVREVTNSRGTGALDRLADDWDTLAADDAGWEEGFPDPRFISAWRQHRQVYGYTLRSELVYQLLNEIRSNPNFVPADVDAILVDEYQDLNNCELRTIRNLSERAEASVFAAGDDDQSIYRFRHAHPAGIRSFDQDYPDSRKLVLTECMRCGPAIVQLANWLISHDLRREPKELVSVTDWDASVHLVRFQNQQSEAAGLARMVKAEIEHGTSAEEILVLVKSDLRERIFSAVKEALEQLDERLYRPRATVSDNEELQTLLEFLVLAAAIRDDKTDDLAIRSLMQLEDNRVGSERLWRITKLALDRGLRFNAALDYAQSHPDEFPTGQFSALVRERDRIVELARFIRPEDGESFDEWLSRVVEKLSISESTYELVVAATHQVELEHGDAAVETVPDAPVDEDGVTNRSEPPPATLDVDFIQELRVALTQLSETLPARMTGHVTFTTMHGAKGLSADTVFILQAEDEVIPGDLTGPDLEEARRLFYVSVTRARKKLVISACDRRTGPQRFVGQQEATVRHLTSFVRDYPLQAQTVEQFLAGFTEG